MNTALSHRGPDDGGQSVDRVCGLAMRRLSIIDLSTGHQPIENEDGTLVVVFNGEIYNFADLRKQLQATGRHIFKTHSDTEVILHLYEEYGATTPLHLNGMFAFCIYDRRDQSLFIARDRFGEKPLYYYHHGQELAFSSEIASLLQWSRVPRKLDYDALYYLLHLGYIPSPSTLFEGIKQLPAGQSMRWKTGLLRLESYYSPTYWPSPSLQDEQTAVEGLRQTLIKAVSSQMVSDVPLGAFLSGGIDSSTVAAAMSQVSRKPVKTFTARFEHLPFDEGPIARAVAERIGSDHHEFVISNRSFDDEDLWRMTRHFGQPFLDSSAIPTYFISREIRQHVTVALSGDGGDEVFAGYPFFSDGLTVDRLASLPRPALKVGSRMLESASALSCFKPFSGLRKARRAFDVASMPYNRRPSMLECLFDLQSLDAMVSSHLKLHWASLTDSMTEKVLDSVSDATRLRQLMHYRVKFSLSEDMLTKVDRMSMAASLEVRAPLLSVEVTDFAAQLPDALLINKGVKKFLLREAGRPWLPDVVYSHPKTGFTIPLHMFQNKRYAELCGHYLLETPHPIIAKLFNRDSVAQIIGRGIRGGVSPSDMSVHRASHQLWGLVQLGVWAHAFQVSI